MIVFVPRLSDRNIARSAWLNESFWRSNNVTTKILYVIGSKSEMNATLEHDSIILTNLTESRWNLKFKVRAALKYVQKHYSFDYVIKTDIDVINNFVMWKDKLSAYNETNPLYYGGALCQPHLGVEYNFCSGMGYVLHYSVVHHLTQYPYDLMEGAEDRNTGKCMYELGIKVDYSMFFAWKQELNTSTRSMLMYHWRDCKANLAESLRTRGSLHFHRTTTENMLDCWKSANITNDNIID